MSGTCARKMTSFRLCQLLQQNPLALTFKGPIPSSSYASHPPCSSYHQNAHLPTNPLLPPSSMTPMTPGWCRQWVRHRKNVMSRLVLNMEDPSQEKRKSPKDNWVTADTRPNKSASVFNLTMGEIIVGQSFSRIAVEGARMVEEGVQCGLELEKVFLLKSLKTLPEGLDYLLEEEKEQLLTGIRTPEIHRIGVKSMETWSALVTPPGIIGIFKKPQPEDKRSTVPRMVEPLPITVICDNVRDPGNLGSILRSVAGAGCDEVILTKGCVDPWNMKVLRGGSGAHFRLPITPDACQIVLPRLIEKKMMKIVGKGVPNKSGVGGHEDKFSITICDSNPTDVRLPGLPSVPFRDVDYSPYSHNFLIVGGETEGISDMTVTTLKLLQKMSSVDIFRTRIPLVNGVESLNAANACGIIVFEIVRQLQINK